VNDAKQQAGVDVVVVSEVLRQELETAIREESDLLGGRIERTSVSLAGKIERTSVSLSGRIESQASSLSEAIERESSERTRTVAETANELAGKIEQESVSLSEKIERNASSLVERIEHESGERKRTIAETAAKCADALDEEIAGRKNGDAEVGDKIAREIGAVAAELKAKVLELSADITTESEVTRAHCEAHAEQVVALLQNTVTEGLGLNAEALSELRGDVASAVERLETIETSKPEASGGAGDDENNDDAKSVHSDISEAKERLNEMQREIESVKTHAEKQVAELLAKSQEELKQEMNKGNEATAAMLAKIMSKLDGSGE
jgi:hypothetical protein